MQFFAKKTLWLNHVFLHVSFGLKDSSRPPPLLNIRSGHDERWEGEIWWSRCSAEETQESLEVLVRWSRPWFFWGDIFFVEKKWEVAVGRCFCFKETALRLWLLAYLSWTWWQKKRVYPQWWTLYKWLFYWMYSKDLYTQSFGPFCRIFAFWTFSLSQKSWLGGGNSNIF